MFTGIIEAVGEVKEVFSSGSNRTFWILSSLSSGFTIDQSVCHNGVCLTVEEVKNGMHRVTAIDETLKKTNLGDWRAGAMVNIERSMSLNGRLDGHIVQGHIDSTSSCVDIKNKGGSWEFLFEIPKKFSHLIIEKGSIAINGVSLTVFDVKRKTFKVAIIPYTYEHTNIKHVERGEKVNIEFDMFGKYISRIIQLQET